MESNSITIKQSFEEFYSHHARESLDELSENFTITDPSISGHPIIFASHAFLKMTGFTRDEVVGRSGSIFQGPATCRRSVLEIREAVREERETNVVLVPLDTRSRVSSSSNSNSLQVHDFVFRCCRKEVCSDSLAELGRVSSGNQVIENDVTVKLSTTFAELHLLELESEEPREASDDERRSAVTAIDNIFSVLTHYSELTGRLVCRKRCSTPDVGLLSSSLIISLGRIKQSFVLTNPHLPDMPIVYASDAFMKLTGPKTLPCYARDEVLGRNCRFLGGRNTDDSTLHLITESIKTEQPCTVRILNYRKDKSSFWNLLHISPVRDASGKVAYFVGVQIEDNYKNEDYRQCWRPDMKQLSVVGIVKVAVRSLSMSAGSSKR
ncbi:hypothetical protein TSUD_396350 [Trifolium subterraneum]|uniref:LOV domain-containing protein n=1 Tax=Trifolium subterraneum TaxID=3900 RepID=A0A2Z6P847_TRISU|nr:hypothetical protein TSUD_396350 [Trifolium subterraneum]